MTVLSRTLYSVKITYFWMCLLMTYTELVVTENESMHPNMEFTHQIKGCYYLKAC